MSKPIYSMGVPFPIGYENEDGSVWFRPEPPQPKRPYDWAEDEYDDDWEWYYE